MRPSTDPAAASAESPPRSAAASRGVAGILEGPRAPAVVLGASSRAAWMETEGHVVVLSGPGPTRLPNGVTVAGAEEVLPTPGDRCVIGEGTLELGGTDVAVVRWWDPSPSLPTVTRDVLAFTSAVASQLLLCSGCEALEEALRSRNLVAIERCIHDLLGKGSGLTPEGDDVLVGVLAGLKLLGPAMGAPWTDDLMRSIEPILVVEAPFRTTSFSVALLRHAALGEVAAPVAQFLQALTGRAPLFDSIEHLRDMGETSGAATACGVLIAAHLLTSEGDDDR